MQVKKQYHNYLSRDFLIKWSAKLTPVLIKRIWKIHRFTNMADQGGEIIFF